MEKQAHAAQFTSHLHQPTNELKLFLKKEFLFPHPTPHSCLISDDPHIGIIVSWPMTFRVDFLRFEGHLSVIEVKTQNADTHQHYLNQSKGFK